MADRIITNVYLDIELKKMARKDALDKGITFRDWLEDAIRTKLEPQNITRRNIRK